MQLTDSTFFQVHPVQSVAVEMPKKPDIAELHSSLANLSPPWINQTSLPVTKIHLCVVSNQSSTSTEPMKVTHSLTVNEDLTWIAFVFGQRVKPINTPLSNTPEHLKVDSLHKLLELLLKSNVCPGNPDERFVRMLLSRKGQRILADDGTTGAYVDDGFDITVDGNIFHGTVRTSSCTILSHGSKCHSCRQYRAQLRSLYSRWLHRKITPSKNENNRYLSSPQKKEKLKRLQVRAQTAEKEVQRLKLRIKESTEKHGIEVQDELHQDLSSIMETSNEAVTKEYPPGSFRRLFWDEQLKANRLKDARQMRWHPMMIRWCLNLKLLSTSSYHSLRTSGFIKLPSERTLRDYTHFFKAKCGFQDEVDGMLASEMKLDELPEWKKHVVLLLDEMKVKESLVYDKNEVKVIGFVNLGAVNDQIDQLEKEGNDNAKPLDIANHILAIMVQGIFVHLRFPYAHFPTKGEIPSYNV